MHQRIYVETNVLVRKFIHISLIMIYTTMAISVPETYYLTFMVHGDIHSLPLPS